ncbi:hypothetical protein [Robertmurraya andreesenii]|uniref:Uncharacterized protein n=1 Tax=Anoxybacillus andreesenii TaxID=1325932 RepID=A0ABT9V5A2_9BACL|nr:hypothetical protein [Robertmurraya andreesenii]MDQ0156118.1 hypothetical protein [Robertmurraya andreesenii]
MVSDQRVPLVNIYLNLSISGREKREFDIYIWRNLSVMKIVLF